MKKRYLTLIDIGYGHQTPIFISSTDKEILHEAYELYLEDEANECLLSDNEPEDLRPPEVYELTFLKSDPKLFLKMCRDWIDKRDQKDKGWRDAREAALAKLSAEDKKALGLPQN